MKMKEIRNRFKTPDSVEYVITLEEFEQIVNDTITEKTGMEVEVKLDVDIDTGFIRTVIDDEETSEESVEILAKHGFNTQEWYLVTDVVLYMIFDTTRVSAYIISDIGEEVTPQSFVSISVGYEQFQEFNDSL